MPVNPSGHSVQLPNGVCEAGLTSFASKTDRTSSSSRLRVFSDIYQPSLPISCRPSARSGFAPRSPRLRSEHGAVGTSERPGAPLVANLEIVRGPYSGASFSIDRPVCTIGRAAESDVRIRDESVSANHATLLRKGTAWFVVDLRSASGTFVDGLRIAGERELTSGSRLKLGRVELMFRALDGGVETAIAGRRAPSWLLDFLISFFSRRSRVLSADLQCLLATSRASKKPPVSSTTDRAGDGTRTHDVQLGKSRGYYGKSPYSLRTNNDFESAESAFTGWPERI